MVKMFRCWCPLGHVCKKKNATIGLKPTLKDARWTVVNHLHASQLHKISWKDAEKVVDEDPSCIASEDDEGGDDAGRPVDNASARPVVNAYLALESDQVVEKMSSDPVPFQA